MTLLNLQSLTLPLSLSLLPFPPTWLLRGDALLTLPISHFLSPSPPITYRMWARGGQQSVCPAPSPHRLTEPGTHSGHLISSHRMNEGIDEWADSSHYCIALSILQATPYLLLQPLTGPSPPLRSWPASWCSAPLPYVLHGPLGQGREGR